MPVTVRGMNAKPPSLGMEVPAVNEDSKHAHKTTLEALPEAAGCRSPASAGL